MDDLFSLLIDLQYIVEVLEYNILLLEVKDLTNNEIETAMDVRKIIEKTLSRLLHVCSNHNLKFWNLKILDKNK